LKNWNLCVSTKPLFVILSSGSTGNARSDIVMKGEVRAKNQTTV